MSDPTPYSAVPSRLVDGLGQLGAPPPKGEGRLRLDMSLNIWTLIACGMVLVLALFLVDRMHTQIQILTAKVDLITSQQDTIILRLTRIEAVQSGLNRDLYNFPLHRHVGDSRVDIFPYKSHRRDEE